MPIVRAVRLIALRELLRDKYWWTAGELAERLAVSRRTVQRDIAALGEEPLYEPIMELPAPARPPRYRSIAR